MTSTTSPTPNPTALEESWGRIRQPIAGVPVVATTVRQAADALRRAAQSVHAGGRTTGEHVHLASAQTIALAASDRSMDEAVNGSGWTLPDGKPITWISALRRDQPRLHQTRGLEVFEAVCEAGLPHGLKHYLLGSTDETLEKMQQALERRFPGIRIVGAVSPPFRPATEQELRERDAAIAASGAQIVWVGLGTPKQDFEVARLAASLPVVAMAVGAVFDFTAGTLQVAPRWLSAVGLEWLFRLVSEPKRLWHRYTVDSTTFLVAALRWGRRHRTRPAR